MNPVARRSSFTAFILFMLVSLACNLSLPAFTGTPSPTPTATALPLPPAIVETVPPIGSEIPLQAPLTVYFSEAMERSSVEAAFSSSSGAPLLFTWLDDATLSILPAQALPPESPVSFTLGSGAKTLRNGLTLPDAVTLNYRTAGLLRVGQVLPAAAATDVAPDSAVVAAFNQPVVPLGADSSSLPAGFSLEPAANGQGTWLNTSTYIFYPAPALAGGLDYTVRINPALKSTSGTPLDPASQNLLWSFHTALPAVLGVTPLQDQRLGLDPKIEVTFNQPMDRPSVETAVALRAPDGSAVPGTFAWNDRGSVVTFTSSGGLLARATTFTLTVGAEARSRGGKALGSAYLVEYATVDRFAFQGANIANGEQRPVSGLTLFLGAPLNAPQGSDIGSQLQISPQPAYFGASPEGETLSIYGDFTPGQLYTLTLPATLADPWGQSLGQPVQFTFREPDASPALSYGNYSPELFTRPEEATLSLRAVNIKTILLSRGTLSLDDFFRLESDYQYRQSFLPADNTSWTLHPELALNNNQPVEVSLGETPLTPGLYYINAESPDLEQSSYNNNARFLLSSNINLTVKSSPTETLVWAVDLRTQTPVSGASLRLFDQKGGRIASGQTDSNGLWRGSLPEGASTAYVVLGNPGEDLFGLGSPGWQSGIGSWDFGLPGDPSGPHTTGYLYSDRPVYRPGDTIHFRGVLRSLYDGRYTESGLTSLSIRILAPNGLLAEQPAQLSRYGTFAGEYTLPAHAIPGGYSLLLDPGDNSYFPGSSLYFQVADYRKPELNLSVEFSPASAQNGDPLTASLHAAYFFGSPVADLPFTWQLYSRSTSFPIPDYNTGLYSSNWLSTGEHFGTPMQNGTGRTDADGNFSIPLGPLNVEDTSELTLEITATESGGFPVSARASLTAHPDSFYIGIRPQVWVGQANMAQKFDLLSLDLAHTPLSRPITVDFKKVRWERQDFSYGNYRFTPFYTPIASQSITTGADGAASLAFTPPEAGTYLLEASSGSAKTQVLVWVGGSENAVWPNLPYDQVRLTANATRYKPGETAEIFLPNPFNAPALALFTTERSTFKSVQIVPVPAAGYRYKLPITDAEAPNIYLSATLLGPGAQFRQGYINLPVDPSAFELNVELQATPANAKPGDTLTLDLTVTDRAGQPVQGEFSMAVVDLAALALADPNSEDILPAYYSQQPLGVYTGLTDAIHTHRLLDFPGGMGGGGGDATLVLREKFPDTAYWKTDILTDAQGKAHLTLTLPDSLTTWQVETRGLTQDTRVGQARVKVVTSKELLIRPQTPRFLVVGDRAELAAMVNNNTAQQLEATVSLAVTGFSLDSTAQAEQKVTIPANGRVRVSWTGRVQAGAAVEASFSAKSGNLQDSARPTDGSIPVLRYSAPQTFSTAGILTQANSTQTEILALPRTFQPLGGQLDLELSPSLASTILTSLAARTLPETPWSTEEILSNLLPDVVTYQSLQSAGLDNPALKNRLAQNLQNELNLLFSAQKYDGGWPWVLGAEQSDPYLTAYILFGLSQIQNNLPETLSNDVEAATRLASTLESGRAYLFANAEPLNGSVDLTLPAWANQAAFYTYVLQETGGLNDLAFLPETLYAGRERLDPWAKAMLAQTLLSLTPGDERAQTLFSDLEAGALRSASGAHWESTQGGWMSPGSALYTSAVVLAGLAQTQPASPLAADAVRYLASQRGPKGWWASSYETSWILLALNRYMVATGEFRADFAFSAGLNGEKIAQGQAAGPQNLTTVSSSTPLTQLMLNGANQLTISRENGSGQLYYRAALTVDRPVETAPALNQGLAVSREFLHCTGSNCQPVTSYQMQPDEAGRVSVRLTVSVPQEVYYFSVTDYIPAGAEILNSALKTSQQGETSTSAAALVDPSRPFDEGWGWWYFHTPQIYPDHIQWNADYLPAGTYQLTYTLLPALAGEYRALPAHAWLTYFPEVQGTTAGAVFTILP